MDYILLSMRYARLPLIVEWTNGVNFRDDNIGVIDGIYEGPSLNNEG